MVKNPLPPSWKWILFMRFYFFVGWAHEDDHPRGVTAYNDGATSLWFTAFGRRCKWLAHSAVEMERKHSNKHSFHWGDSMSATSQGRLWFHAFFIRVLNNQASGTRRVKAAKHTFKSALAIVSAFPSCVIVRNRLIGDGRVNRPDLWW